MLVVVTIESGFTVSGSTVLKLIKLIYNILVDFTVVICDAIVDFGVLNVSDVVVLLISVMISFSQNLKSF